MVIWVLNADVQKMDLGECRNLHSTPLKMAYPLLLLFLTATIMRMPLHLNKHNYDEEVARGKNYGYEYELEKYLEQIVGDCDRKIQRAQKRLEETEKEKVCLHLNRAPPPSSLPDIFANAT